MNVLFIYPDLSPEHSRRFNVGVAQLASCLKQAGHSTHLYHYYAPTQTLDMLTDYVCSLKPDVLAYSAITNQMPNIRRIAEQLAPLGIYGVLGGVHPTLAPEECLDILGINAVCRGEGELAFVEFLDRLADGGDITHVANFWVKNGGVIQRNDCRPLIENLDSLPPPDYELFRYEELPEYTVNRSLVVAASRGCPHDCTYCCNHALRTLYPNSPRHYLRYRSPSSTLKTINHGLTLYPELERVRFIDDTLSQRKEWFREFAGRYKTEIGLPYSTNDRCTAITEEVADLYAASGCMSVDLGIESGNQEIRDKVMNRRMSEEQILNAFGLLKSRGVNVNAFNILGMPGETMSTIIETLKINAQLHPTMTYNAFFQPFPGTEARKMCGAQGLYMEEEFPPGLAIRPMVQLPSVSADELIFIGNFFRLLMHCYEAASGHSGRMVQLIDRVLLSRRLPYRLINILVPTPAEFRHNHPHISGAVTSMVRKWRRLTKSRKRY